MLYNGNKASFFEKNRKEKEDRRELKDKLDLSLNPPIVQCGGCVRLFRSKKKMSLSTPIRHTPITAITILNIMQYIDRSRFLKKMC